QFGAFFLCKGEGTLQQFSGVLRHGIIIRPESGYGPEVAGKIRGGRGQRPSVHGHLSKAGGEERVRGPKSGVRRRKGRCQVPTVRRQEAGVGRQRIVIPPRRGQENRGPTKLVRAALAFVLVCK